MTNQQNNTTVLTDDDKLTMRPEAIRIVETLLSPALAVKAQKIWSIVNRLWHIGYESDPSLKLVKELEIHVEGSLDWVTYRNDVETLLKSYELFKHDASKVGETCLTMLACVDVDTKGLMSKLVTLEYTYAGLEKPKKQRKTSEVAVAA